MLAVHSILKLMVVPTIEQVNSIQFLGIFIDSKMDWKRQHNFVSSKLSRIIGIFKKISKYLNTDTLVLIFKSLFMEYLNYCSHIWGNTFDSNKKYIIQLQN